MLPPKVIVSGAIANKPRNGGEAWVRLSWVLGLERLGCDVHFVEQISDDACADEHGAPTGFERSVNLDWFRKVVERHGIAERSTLVRGDGPQTEGMAFDDLLALAAEADLLVNISGHLHVPTLMERLRLKAYIDLDPGFTQFWHAEGNPGARIDGHDLYFTVGENIGRDRCEVPTAGIEWRPLPPPTMLADWTVEASPLPPRFTTIATWRGPFGPVEHGGRTFGLKVHEFRKMIELPERAPLEFEIALDIHPADDRDREALVSHGWKIVDPRQVVPDTEGFRAYVQGSGAEFSVAQGVYVQTANGWFSDRTVRYLAAGKPALVQDTGFSRNYPVGEGLIAFSTLDQAAEGARRIAADYERHSLAARALAEEHFDSDRVLARFLGEVDLEAPPKAHRKAHRKAGPEAAGP